MAYEYEEGGYKYSIPKAFHFGKIVFKPINASSELNFDGYDDSKITALKNSKNVSSKYIIDSGKFRMLSKLSSKKRVEYFQNECKEGAKSLKKTKLLYDSYFTYIDERIRELRDE